ncbi:MAG: hypothetical protein IT567_01245 [Alphaproteobacteria bacterium]|nr:hypothetical protein [Alphaproteobacteria bacterium]
MFGPNVTLVISGIKPPFSQVIVTPDGERAHARFNLVAQRNEARDAIGEVLLRMADAGYTDCIFNADRQTRWITTHSADETAALLKVLNTLGYIPPQPAQELRCVPKSKEFQRLESFSVIFPSADTPDAPAMAKATFKPEIPAERIARICDVANEGAHKKMRHLTFTLSEDGRSILAAMGTPEHDVPDIANIFGGMGGVLSYEGENNLLRALLPQIAPTTHITHSASLATPVLAKAGLGV